MMKASWEKNRITAFCSKKLCCICQKVYSQALREAVEECVNTETKVKTGLMTDTMSVELLLVKFSR